MIFDMGDEVSKVFCTPPFYVYFLNLSKILKYY